VRRSGPGEARIILLLHIISDRPSKRPLMVRTLELWKLALKAVERARARTVKNPRRNKAKTIEQKDTYSQKFARKGNLSKASLKVYMELGSYFVSARTNKRHHHRAIGDARLGRGGPHACSIGHVFRSEHNTA
jgi:hypothetical protein